MIRYVLLGLLLSVLSACSSDDGEKEQQPQGVIPQHQLQALEKAKQVEDTLKQAEQERRDQLDQ